MLVLLDILISVIMTISPKRLTEKDYFVELYVCKKLWNEWNSFVLIQTVVDDVLFHLRPYVVVASASHGGAARRTQILLNVIYFIV